MNRPPRLELAANIRGIAMPSVGVLFSFSHGWQGNTTDVYSPGTLGSATLTHASEPNSLPSSDTNSATDEPYQEAIR
jgi:hypothetical protein